MLANPFSHLATVHGPGETKRQPHAVEVERAYYAPDGLIDAIRKGNDDILVFRKRRRTLSVFVFTFLLVAVCADAIQ